MFNFESKKLRTEIPIQELINSFDIILLGETNHGTHDGEILELCAKVIDQIKGVFVELPIDYQSDIDTYVRSGTITPKLESYFSGAEREGKYIRGILNLFELCKQHHKGIFCIDSSKRQTSEYKHEAKYGKYFTRGSSRNEDMFLKIEEQYTKESGKYIVVVGAGHIEQHPDRYTGEDSLSTEMEKRFSGFYTSVELTT